MGREILRRIEKTLSAEIKRAKKIIFFLDYDGTLVPIRKKPQLARLTKNTKILLARLSREKWAEVFIISGRALRDLKSTVALSGISYSGNHGIEFEGPGLNYVNPTAKAARPYIQKCYRALKKKLKTRGIIVENKVYTFSVHYRLVRPEKVESLADDFRRATEDFRRDKKIKITHGKKVFEVRPNIEWHKGKIIARALKKTNLKFTLPIYIGDDITDEDAFRALEKKGVSVLVSKKKRKTAARYRLSSPKDVVGLLKFIMRERQ